MIGTEFELDMKLARARQSDRRELLRASFSEDEIEWLEAARQAVRLEQATIVYCVYENPFAKSGGIFAVADNYCSALQAAGKNVLVVTPCHTKLRTAPTQADTVHVGECRVSFGNRLVKVDLLEHVSGGVRWILLRADGFFEADGGAGRLDPYVDADPSRLLRDSLFCSAAVPQALAALGHRQNLLIHVQDWELATTALTTKLALLEGRLENAAVVLTSHNPYDHDLAMESLVLIHNLAGRIPSNSSVYQLMIPLVDAPVTTVSRNFAQELLTDPLQTFHFAGHLQESFQRKGIVGVDNGLFGKAQSAFSDEAQTLAATGAIEMILEEKRAKRQRMLDVLSGYQDDRIMGGLTGGGGRALSELPDSVPVFLMFGRMDPGQKGFDVLARAIENLPRGWARFILTPIITGGSWTFEDDLFQLTRACPGEVVIYPFRMSKGYQEAMAGATYAVMPSLYEPFGGATEPYLGGTPVIARATGGLVQQVGDFESDPASATGLLYREIPEGTGQEWAALQMASTPAARNEMPVYSAMVKSLVAALTRAGEIYQSEPVAYGEMLGHLFGRAQMFSWERAMEEYAVVYDLATT